MNIGDLNNDGANVKMNIGDVNIDGGDVKKNIGDVNMVGADALLKILTVFTVLISNCILVLNLAQ